MNARAALHAPPALVLTCEHASNRLPARCARLGAAMGPALESHRGWDPGTLELGRRLARRTGAPLLAGRWTRLLLDLNRSEQHPRLWSEWSRTLPDEARAVLLKEVYRPHRAAVRRALEAGIAKRGWVLHLGLHSFTPVWEGQLRTTDIGLLYDPGREAERMFCRRWKALLTERRPDWRIHANRPYRGVSDGLTTALRRAFPDPAYAGVELEINQRWVTGRKEDWGRALQDVTDTFLAAWRGG